MTPLTEEMMAQRESREVSPSQQLEQQQTRSHVQVAIERLPEREQEMIRLKFQEGMTYRQISHITGKSISNVGFIIHSALRALRKQLRPEFEFAGLPQASVSRDLNEKGPGHSCVSRCQDFVAATAWKAPRRE